MSLPAVSSAFDSDSPSPLRPADAQALLRVGFERFQKKLQELVATAIEGTDDLFETTSHIPDGEVAAFRQKHGEWLSRFQTTLGELFEKRLAGQRRKGLRPDADATAAALRVLTPFDHERQAALTHTARFLTRFTQRELAALDLRVGLLLDAGSTRDLDNPFAVPYILDALGSTSRAVHPDPRVWRPLMERLLADLTPNFNGLYIALNRLLADHGVLPEIKAALRARSEHRPADDRDLLATFTHMLHAVEQPIPANVVVPELSAPPGVAPVLNFDRSARNAIAAPDAAVPPAQPQMIPADILKGLAALTATGNGGASADASAPTGTEQPQATPTFRASIR